MDDLSFIIGRDGAGGYRVAPVPQIPHQSVPSRRTAGNMTVEEFAFYVRVSRATAWRLLKRGAVARTRVGGRTFILLADADAFLKRNREGA
ncbi:helix-turn-helix domain-containing protein [Methylobacterium sp. WL103]|uniref:helix-turn-helix domain-containing protein n=1 Tax=Methylobacterium sp. WL103 TaxID=2603891 RepID=UPI0011CAC6C7|nr:helix-turn-helix domain-containing protein [Methylobacterium sp. WL103]TXN04967.1 helix-turn-helix domain-containing protein [Methylobacterium sp. WL103]